MMRGVAAGSVQCTMPSCVIVLISLIGLHVLTCAAAAARLPLPPPIVCNSSGCTVENYQRIWLDRKPCKSSQALYPTSEAELYQAVAAASKAGAKVKVVSRGSHSLPKLVCPGGNDGILISTHSYNSIIRVNLSTLTVTAQAGVMLRPLIDTIAQYNLTLPHTPYWQGVSVAGMISTGAHGSSLWGKGSAPHDYVVGMRLILPASEEEGYAKIVDLNEKDPDLDAARLSLGVLGAISEVTFQLEPMFKRSVRLELSGDESLEEGMVKFGREHEFGALNWYPAAGKVLYKVDDRVGVDTPGEGAYKLAIVDKLEVGFIESLRSSMDAYEERKDIDELCQVEEVSMTFRYTSGDGLVNDGVRFTGYPVTGFNHQMQTSGGCEKDDMPSIMLATGTDLNVESRLHQHDRQKDTTIEEIIHEEETVLEEKYMANLAHGRELSTCNWNPLLEKGFFFFDTSIAIPVSKIRDAILDIKKLRDAHPKAMCSLGHLGGLWIRFASKSKAYLGEASDVVMFEMLYYRAKEPHTPRFYQDLFEEIEQILVFKYGGKPHWGKNRDVVFQAMETRTLAMDKFLEVMKRYDPSRLFSNEWTDGLLGISSTDVQAFQDHCALEGVCVCKEDSHCHPAKGYFCRPGRLYKEARVCRYENLDLLK